MNKLDCGDSSCYYAENKSGMRTNGGCRCHEKFHFRNVAREWFEENERLNRWKELIERAPEFEAQKVAVERFLKTEAMQPIIQVWREKVNSLEAENVELLSALKALEDEAFRVADSEKYPHLRAAVAAANAVLEKYK